MANPSGDKGYRGEAPVLAHLLQRGFHRVYRLRSQGVSDKGDIGGIDGVCIEVKNRGVYNLAGWMKETAREKGNSGAETSALVIKPKGVGDTRVGQWWVMMTLDEYVDLIEHAGYGPHRKLGDGSPQESLSRTEPGA